MTIRFILTNHRDKLQYLYQNITDEYTFYQNTNKFNTDYFFIQKGSLYKSEFCSNSKLFKGLGEFDIKPFYD